MNYLARFTRRPDLCGGETVIQGTRIPVHVLLSHLAAGETSEEILTDFPSLTREDIQAVIAFAAASAVEDLPIPAAPSTTRLRDP